MSEEIKFDHFKDINELLEHIDLWYREDDIEYTRWFGLEDLYNLKIYMTSLQQKVEQLEKENKRLNNIINGLEKHLNQEIIEWQDANDLWIKAQVQEDRLVLNKLNELKENK